MAADTNLEEASRFLQRLAPDGEITFQTFDDDKKRKNRFLARVLHGSLEQHAQDLIDLNNRGAGVFVMVNRGNGTASAQATCRSNSNVLSIRALFVDLDGAPLEPVMAANRRPDIVIESSPGRYHAYWMAVGCRLDEFSSYQKSLARKFSGDQSVHDLARVMRVPGFLHNKGDAFVTRILEPAH
jgi:hypothetical protein